MDNAEDLGQKAARLLEVTKASRPDGPSLCEDESTYNDDKKEHGEENKGSMTALLRATHCMSLTTKRPYQISTGLLVPATYLMDESSGKHHADISEGTDEKTNSSSKTSSTSLNLPPEIFEEIVLNLSSKHLWNLLRYNHALFKYASTTR